ncbi:MAG: hypothetical protein JXA57_14295 [Armatimonadetes bacterium]|nr:hypothetical protein [Armatimonadota bacterium]
MIARPKNLSRTDTSLARRIGLASLLTWLVLIVVVLPVGHREAAGAALGGGLILVLFALHLRLAQAWLRSGAKVAQVCLWLLCFLKWPLVIAALFVAIRAGIVAPVWVCVGASVVPAVATAIGLRMLRLFARTEGAA